MNHVFRPTILGIVLLSSSLSHGAATRSADRRGVVAAYAKTQQQDPGVSADKNTVSQIMRMQIRASSN